MPGQNLPIEGFLHPLHAILLAFPVALFPATLVSDLTYLNTAVVQWTHFSAWLLVGALLAGGAVLLWAAAGFFHRRASTRRGRAALYLLAVAIMWLAGLVNAFQHSHDAWSSVGTFGLVLSIIGAVAALAAGWIGYSAASVREAVR